MLEQLKKEWKEGNSWAKLRWLSGKIPGAGWQYYAGKLLLTSSINKGEEIKQHTRENHKLQTQQVSSHKRPLSVTLLVMLVLLITGFHLIRFIRALYLWDTLVALPGVPILYIALTGLLWTIIGIPCLWWLWKGHPRAPRATVIGALAFTVYYWVDRLIVANNLFEHSNFPFMVAVNVVLIAFTAWALFNPKSSRYFNVSR